MERTCLVTVLSMALVVGAAEWGGTDEPFPDLRCGLLYVALQAELSLVLGIHLQLNLSINPYIFYITARCAGRVEYLSRWRGYLAGRHCLI